MRRHACRMGSRRHSWQIMAHIYRASTPHSPTLRSAALSSPSAPPRSLFSHAPPLCTALRHLPPGPAGHPSQPHPACPSPSAHALSRPRRRMPRMTSCSTQASPQYSAPPQPACSSQSSRSRRSSKCRLHTELSPPWWPQGLSRYVAWHGLLAQGSCPGCSQSW